MIILLGELDFSEAYGAKRKKKMKFDEQDRVRDHALGFYLAIFLVIQPTQIFLSKTDANRTRAPKMVYTV